MDNVAQELRARAMHSVGTGDLEAALASIAELIDSGQHTLDDVYLAGEWSLDLARYRDTISYMTQVLVLSASAQDTWYSDAAYIARAFAHAQMGGHGLAKEDLSNVPDEVELSWLKCQPRISKQTILRLMGESKRL